MRSTTRLLLCAGAAGVSAATGGCKVQPVDGNVDRRQAFGAGDEEAAPAKPGAAPAAQGATKGAKTGGGTGPVGAPKGPSGAPKGPGAAAAGKGGAQLGPAARESLKYLPMGEARGDAGAQGDPDAPRWDEVPHPDRWRVGFPAWERGSQSDSPWDKGALWDPYHQNVLKGDYPIPGTQNRFMVLEAVSTTKVESRKTPTPSSIFTHDRGSDEFFGNFHSESAEELLTVSVDVFQGETLFKPVDWRVLVKGAASWNYARAEENLVLYADPARGRSRNDEHYTIQQAFFETTLASVSPKYDVIQARLGIQQFNSDFRGFLFFDETMGARVFGNWDDNRWQWNLGWFPRLEKDTNSGLNRLRGNGQDVYLANLYRQDALSTLLPAWKDTAWSHGLTTQVSVHHLDTDPSVHYDENDFLVRPRGVGSVQPARSNATWLGWTNDGHIGRINVTSAFYHVTGEAEIDEIAGREVDVRADLAALELSIDKDWMRFRIQGLWQSGDDDPQDGRAGGFDAIFDNENFAGGDFGFWNRQAIRLTGSGVGLVQGGSLYNTLRSSKLEGNPSFVNPGLRLVGAGWDAQLTPKMKLITNASYLWFDETSSIEYVLGQGKINDGIGWDLSAGVVWRPLLTDNVIVKSGVAALVPGNGFRDIYTAETLYAVFAELILTW